MALDPGVTALVGPNGQGKTNLVEAVGYVASHSSHRVASDAPLVRLEADRAYVRAQVVSEGRPTLVELEINPGKANRARLNRSPLPRAREALGVLRSVLFAPEDLALVKGDPAERRRFLDELLVSRTPRLAGVRSDYERVVRQRSTLLKSAGPRARELPTLDVWDGQLATVGAELLAARLELLAALGPLVSEAYRAVAPGGEAVLEYRCSLGPDFSPLTPGPDHPALAPDRSRLVAALLAELERNRRAELERGVCLVGPHRDDLVLRLGPLPAKGYASHGESWSYALALRLASYELLRQDGGEPVLVLDDVFAELDTERRRRLAELSVKAEQVLVTAAVAADVPEALSGSWVDVLGGEVNRVR